MTATILAPDLSLILAQYVESLRRRKRSPLTQRGFVQAATRYDRWLKDRGLTAESAQMADIEDYFDQLTTLAPSTKALHLRQLRAAYNYAILRGTLRHNPSIDVMVEESIPKEPRIIPNEVLREIRAGITRDADWVFYHLLVWTGMRRFEVAGLRWDDGDPTGSAVKLDDHTIRVLGKGNKMRVVPIHPALYDCLTQTPQVGRFVIPSDGKNGISLDKVQAIVKRLHPVYTPHDYRRTVATSMRRNGVDESVRNRIMGWGPKDIFMRHYDNVADTELHRGILKLYADDPID